MGRNRQKETKATPLSPSPQKTHKKPYTLTHSKTFGPLFVALTRFCSDVVEFGPLVCLTWASRELPWQQVNVSHYPFLALGNLRPDTLKPIAIQQAGSP